MLAAMFTSSAEVFRTRQAVRDLAEAVGQHREAVQALGITGADQHFLSQSIVNGCRIDITDNKHVLSALLLAAALPDEHFSAFIGSTALLLADCLQSDTGLIELKWSWEAFHDHYRLAGPPVRTALMNGFRLLAEKEQIELVQPPEAQDCLTYGAEDILDTLSSVGAQELGDAVRADVSAADAGRLWWNVNPARPNWQMLAGFRYLYERPLSMSPTEPETAPLIPWV